MRILVTGGTGLIGRQLIDRLGPRHEVVALARHPPADERIQWVRRDLAEPLEGLPDQLDAVIHLAQSARYREFPDGAEDVFAVNVQSTFGLLEHARRSGVRSFVLASTGGLYGFGDHPIDEEAPVRANSPYTRSKLIAELLTASYEQFFSCIVLRPFFVYGVAANQGLVSRFARQIHAGEEIHIDGLPGMRINPLYAADAAAAIEAALDVDSSEVLNLGGDEVITIGDLAQKLGAALGREAILRSSGADSPGDLIADTTRMRQRLGVAPAVSLDEGLAIVGALVAEELPDGP